MSSIFKSWIITSNGKQTEYSKIQSLIIGVITKSDDHAAGVQVVYHQYDYRLDWMTQSLTNQS